MIYYDGVIYNLQKGGGVSVLFNELIRRLPEECYQLSIPKFYTPFGRYISCRQPNNAKIFHSTYYRLARDFNGSTVTTVHDFTYEKYNRGLKQKVHGWQKEKAVQGADVIICVSNSTKSDLLDYYGAALESRIQVVHNGVSEDYYSIPNYTIKNQVLFIGSRNGYKNFKSTVIGLSCIKDVNLICVGGGGFTKAELAFLDKLLPGRYKHAGFLSNEALNYEYNSSICLLYPSKYEGFGIPVLEAMRASCPVVAVNASSIPEVAGDAAYLLDKGNSEEIQQSIEYFMISSNRDLYIKKGLIQASKFSWDKTYQDTLEVYEKLLGYNIGVKK